MFLLYGGINIGIPPYDLGNKTMKKSIDELLIQDEWTYTEIRILNRYHYHPQNKKKCSGCYNIFDKTTKQFDIHKKENNGEYRLSGRCKTCNSIRRAKRKTMMRNDPKWYCRNLIASLRCRAKNENLPFDISGEYLYNTLIEQDFRCYYTGLLIDLTATSSKQNKSHKNMGSVDKKIPSNGYVENNVVWTIWDANRIKNNLTHDEFISMCNLVTKTHNK